MKRSLILLCLLPFSACSENKQNSAPTTATENAAPVVATETTASMVAIEGAKSILSTVDAAERERLGFSKNFDVKKISVGKPYKVKVFSKEFMSNDFNNVKNPLVDTSELRFPILEGDQYVALATVYKDKEGYVFSDLGARTLSRELKDVEQSTNGNKDVSEKTLIRHMVNKADFVSFDSGNNFAQNQTLIPLKSFRYFLKFRSHKFSDSKQTISLSEIHRLSK